MSNWACSGQFVLRVVKPWLIDGQLVGYIELGENIEHLTRRVKRTTGADLVVVIDKRYLEYKAWSEMQEQLGSRSGLESVSGQTDH